MSDGEGGDSLIGSVPALVHGRYHLQPAQLPLSAGSGSHELEGAPLLLGCHGYGETAADHLKELVQIPGSERFVVCAVEALHPFYRKDGSIVRCWMTSEDRERAMEDNIRYVSSVIADVRRRHAATGPLVVAGFSQGVAMAWRTVARSGWPCRGLIALAGDVPQDVARSGALGLNGEPGGSVVLGRGTDDGWYSEKKMDLDLATLETMGVAVESCIFEGGHEWSDPFRQAASALLERALGGAEALGGKQGA